MWIIKKDGSAINSDCLIGISKMDNKIIALAADVGRIKIVEYESEKAAEIEYLNIISALEQGDRSYYVNGGPWA